MKKLQYIYAQKMLISDDDDVAMGFPLGLFLANVFMVKLERTIIPSLCDKIKLLEVLLW